MDSVARTKTKYDDKWYYWCRCPILPMLTIRPSNEHNVWSFNWHWLIFRIWSMSSPDIGFEMTLSDQDLQIRVRIPYLITGVFIPLFPWKFHQKLWHVKKYEWERSGH